MNNIPKNIIDYLQENKVSSVCFLDLNNKPYCINCFYEYDETSENLIFKSSHGTTHHDFIKNNLDIAGTILPNTLDFLKIKGLQFKGKLINEGEIQRLGLSTKYIKKYPMSLAIPGYIWAIKLEFAKLTDSTLGFGNKTIWKFN